MSGGEVTPRSVREEISREILKVHDESYGETAREVKVWVLDDFVLAVIDGEPTVSERTLIEAGRGEAVRDTREAFQEAIAPTFEAIVERATGRRVISFISRMSIDPLYSVEFFRLGSENAAA